MPGKRPDPVRPSKKELAVIAILALIATGEVTLWLAGEAAKHITF